jgi:osmotically-inducible protein OsmY
MAERSAYSGGGGGRGRSYTGQDVYGYEGALQEVRRRRGPKGYRRSDERVRDELCERLIQADYVDPDRISVDVQDGRVILEGTVPQRSMRYALEDLAMDVLGVEDVDNRLRVERRSAESRG